MSEPSLSRVQGGVRPIGVGRPFQSLPRPVASNLTDGLSPPHPVVAPQLANYFAFDNYKPQLYTVPGESHNNSAMYW